MQRRACLITLGAVGAGAVVPTHALQLAAPPPLRFPADFGSHPDTRTEWWYITGSLQSGTRLFGFQITFFRSATGIAADHPSRFAAAQLVFAHAALTDLEGRKLRHDQRIARAGFGVAEAAVGDTRLRLRDWQLERQPLERSGSNAAAHDRYRVNVASRDAGFAFELALTADAPPLLQGEAGLSRKGPAPADTSRYYSRPQLAVQGSLVLDGRTLALSGGRAWLDHEWSDAFLPAGAVGWDWIGINLADGGALTAFRLRRADGSSVYAGGSHRGADGRVRNFASDEVRFVPGRQWRSAASGANYPVQWQVETPAGRHRVEALLDAQELDSRSGTGAVYWEGLSDLFDAANARVGRGYLEMTGYAGTLRI
ncbi:MAG TPA: lipocalin-like domain-containing protein [Burkholderiaceae bacterium]|nr:lipocalin-like domain-containing protein [Burkholderiaceae bacterium]